jgi:Xaa-Pro aminopeptidase
VMAVEPSVYRAGWGGMRLEHMFLVAAGGNELLTQFEHTL